MDEKLSDRENILDRLEYKNFGKKVSSDNPKISVIIPAYNVSQYISDTLDSVLSQTFTDYEIIVVNDGSQDTEELERKLSKYYDNIVYARQKNLGASRARNAGICLARGMFIAFLDSDDFWYPDFLTSQTAYMKNNDLEMAYCNARLVGDDYFGKKTYMESSPSSGEVSTLSLIDATCNVITSGTVVKYSKFEECGLFDPGSPTGAEDFELWFRLAKMGTKIGYQKDILLDYRVSLESLSGSSVRRAERAVEILEFIGEKHLISEAEREVLSNKLNECRAELELAVGKKHLVEGEYDEARKRISIANNYYRKPKLFFFTLLLKISPHLALNVFRRLRPAEFSFLITYN